jgi:hypothetical protein
MNLRKTRRRADQKGKGGLPVRLRRCLNVRRRDAGENTVRWAVCSNICDSNTLKCFSITTTSSAIPSPEGTIVQGSHLRTALTLKHTKNPINLNELYIKCL